MEIGEFLIVKDVTSATSCFAPAGAHAVKCAVNDFPSLFREGGLVVACAIPPWRYRQRGMSRPQSLQTFVSGFSLFPEPQETKEAASTSTNIIFTTFICI